MMDNILDLVKDQVMKTISEKVDIPAEKQQETVETTTSSIVDGFKSQISPSNIGEIMSLFGGGGAGSLANSAIAKGVQSSVVSALTSKVGLNQGLASTIAGLVVPAVISMLSNKAADKNDSSFDLGTLLESFTGGGSKDSSSSSGGLGGMIDMLGGLLGGKGK